MFDDPGIDQFAPDRLQRRKRAFLVGPHQPRIADNIGGQDRRQPPLDPLFAQGSLREARQASLVRRAIT